MKNYVSPKLSMILPTAEDILTVSPVTVVYNEEAGEYWVGGSADWWGGN